MLSAWVVIALRSLGSQLTKTSVDEQRPVNRKGKVRSELHSEQNVLALSDQGLCPYTLLQFTDDEREDDVGFGFPSRLEQSLHGAIVGATSGFYAANAQLSDPSSLSGMGHH